MSARTCLTSVGIGILLNADTFSAFGRRPAGEMEWPRKFASVAPNRAFEGESLHGVAQKVRIGGTQSCLRGGKLEIVLSKVFEEGANRPNMRYQVGIGHDDIIEVSCLLFQVLDHLIDDLDEPPRRGAAALRHSVPLIKACGCAERCKRNCVLVCRYLVNRGNQAEQGNTRPESKEFRTWSARGIGSWLSSC